MASSKLLLAAKALSADPGAPNAKNQLAAAARYACCLAQLPRKVGPSVVRFNHITCMLKLSMFCFLCVRLELIIFLHPFTSIQKGVIHHPQIL